MFCPFCIIDTSRVILENDHAMAIYDGFPVSLGHTRKEQGQVSTEYISNFSTVLRPDPAHSFLLTL